MAKSKTAKTIKTKHINPWPRDGKRTKVKVRRPKVTRVIDGPVPMRSTSGPVSIVERQLGTTKSSAVRRRR